MGLTTKMQRIWVLAAAAMGALLLSASIVAACTALATMDSPQSGQAVEPGQEVKGTGRGFSGQSPNPVEIRFEKRTGELLWSQRASLQGTIDFSFKVPNVPAGQYVVLAIQNDASGNPVSGTPARMSLEVAGAPASSQPPPPAAGQQPAQPAASEPAPSPAPRAVAAPRSPATASPVAPASPPEVAPVATEAAPVPAAPAAAPAPAPSSMKRSMTVPASSGSLLLPLLLVGTGLLLTMGAAALALSGRRDRPSIARSRR